MELNWLVSNYLIMFFVLNKNYIFFIHYLTRIKHEHRPYELEKELKKLETSTPMIRQNTDR